MYFDKDDEATEIRNVSAGTNEQLHTITTVVWKIWGGTGSLFLWASHASARQRQDWHEPNAFCIPTCRHLQQGLGFSRSKKMVVTPPFGLSPQKHPKANGFLPCCELKYVEIDWWIWGDPQGFGSTSYREKTRQIISLHQVALVLGDLVELWLAEVCMLLL